MKMVNGIIRINVNQCESALLSSATNGTDRIITLRLSLSLSLSHISCLVEMILRYKYGVQRSS
jgi:hypothetical protein